MLSARNGTIRVVVDLDVFRAPPQEQREPVCQKNPHHHSQRGGPVLRSSNRRLAPIERANQGAHFAAARQKTGLRNAVCRAHLLTLFFVAWRNPEAQNELLE